MADPTIIICAPNGARKVKADHPALPLTAAELAECATSVRDAGASMIHVHARDAEGRHTLAIDETRRVVNAVNEAVGSSLIVQVTTEAIGIYTPDQQMAMVRAVKPEAVSLALRELCPNEASVPAFVDFCAWLEAEQIFPQIILYDDEDVQRFEKLLTMETFCNQVPFALLVLQDNSASRRVGGDSFGCLTSSSTPTKTSWAICGFGVREHEAVDFAIRRGGHVRVGFENNLRLRSGETAASNADLVREVRDRVLNAGGTPASADEARDCFRVLANKKPTNTCGLVD